MNIKSWILKIWKQVLIILGIGIVASISILNIHSHPQAGDQWAVSFETTGLRDLIITPDDQNTIDDLDFISLKCGEEERTPQILENDVIFYPNWFCTEEGQIIHIVNLARGHILKFQFGGEVKYAYNSPGDVKNHATLTNNLISYWELEETSGERADSHGSNNLTDNNTVLSATGKQGTAADFENNANEYLSKTDTADLSITGDLSFAMWIKIESFPANQTLLGKWNPSGDQRSYSFFISTGNKLRAFISDDGSNANTSKLFFTHTALTTATWYHIVIAYDASAGTMDLWINNSAQTQISGHKTSIDDSTADFGLGNNFADFGYFDGIQDEVGIWNRLLITSEVSDLYNSGAGIPYDEIVVQRIIPAQFIE
ncbi:hypothetical protein LCGC14_2048770 [marine sediment metagenome]|uniref:LamG-like jellyroll fold domain-containing protein n=1 Tax=marine sediment metagenome TaxID=412755 RepID=A0A0F9H336_9ZZZZ